MAAEKSKSMSILEDAPLWRKFADDADMKIVVIKQMLDNMKRAAAIFRENQRRAESGYWQRRA